MHLRKLTHLFNLRANNFELTLNNIPVSDLKNSHFPDYLVFSKAQNIQSTLNKFNVIRCKKSFGFGNSKTNLIKELLRHRNTSEEPSKFFKDRSSDTENNYRFLNIKSASSTVIDDSNFFPLRVNQLVVNNLQIGLSLCAPSKIMLSTYYQFLLKYQIPAIHIILQKEDFYKESDMPQYHTTNMEGKKRNIVKTPTGDIKIFVDKGDIYNNGKVTETQVYFLNIETNTIKHRIKILHTPRWKDHTAISPIHIDELLAIRNHAFDGMQRSNIITHCRAGVGRTGTLLTAEVMSQLHTPLTKTIIDLRDSRNCSMVQTSKQIETLYHWAKEKKHQLIHELN